MSIQNLYPNIAPSLSLDFANTKALDSRVTFARASTARFYDGRSVAKAEENLLLQSQDWSVSPWSSQISVTVVQNAGVAPDGTTTATSLTFSAQFSNRRQIIVTTIAGLSYTFSFYAKRISGNTGLSFFHENSASGDYSSFTITDDWVRYSITVLGAASGGNVNFGIQDRNASGFGEFLVWGAQLEQRSSVTAYTPTTTQPITNYIPVLQTAAAGVPRFDHNPITGESLGLLIEEQRTNLLLRSEEFDNGAWTKGGLVVNPNALVAPDGTLSADLLIPNAATAVVRVYDGFSNAAGQTYTTTWFVKKQPGSTVRWLRLSADQSSGSSWFDLDSGVWGTSAVSTNLTVLPNGWYRIGITYTAAGLDASDNQFLQIVPANGSTSSFTGDGYSGFFVWGAQVEAGAFATSYIPTVASQVTRAADAASMTGANFSSWYRNDEWTLFGDFQTRSGAPMRFGNTLASNLEPLRNNPQSVSANGQGNVGGPLGGGAFTFYSSSGSSSYPSGTFVPNQRQVFCLSLKLNEQATGYSGASATSTNAHNPGAATFSGFYFGGILGPGNSLHNGHIKKIAYYPAKLSPANLAALTEV
jgi:hypothetical protein